MLVTSIFSFSHNVFYPIKEKFYCFSKAFSAKAVNFNKLRFLFFTTQSRLLTTLKKGPFENIVGKEENAGNQHFLLYSIMFSTPPKANFSF